jgi:hypothetical protein
VLFASADPGHGVRSFAARLPTAVCGIVGTIRLVRGLSVHGPIEIFEIAIIIGGTWILASEILRRLRD